MLERKIWDFFREVSIYTIFLWLLYIVSYANVSISSFNYHETLKNTFITPTNVKSVAFAEVSLIFGSVWIKNFYYPKLLQKKIFVKKIF